MRKTWFAIFGLCVGLHLLKPSVLYAASSDVHPAWIARGAATVTHDIGRALYGTGQATFEGDKGQLREKADEAAKKQALHQVDVFIQTLQSHTDAQSQAVVLALQTYKPILDRLVRHEDRFVDGDGTHYSLMAVRYDTLWAIVQKARAVGTILQDITAADFAALFDKQAAIDPMVSAFIGQQDSGWHDLDLKQDIQKIARAAGPEPSWVKASPSATLPASVYLCGVGTGKDLAGAVGAGANALQQPLLQHGQQAAQLFHKAYKRLDAPEDNVISDEDAAKAAWNIVAPTVVGEQVWTVPKKNRSHAAVCLGRVKAYVALHAQLKKMDTELAPLLSAAVDPNQKKSQKEQALSKALGEAKIQQAMAAMLRDINVTGLGAANHVLVSDLEQAAHPPAAPLRLAVQAKGPYELGVANALVAGIHQEHLKPALLAVLPQHDLLLHIALQVPSEKNVKSGPNTQKTPHSATVLADVQLQDLRTHQVLYTGKQTASGQARTNIFDAERAAIQALNPLILKALEPVWPTIAAVAPKK